MILSVNGNCQYLLCVCLITSIFSSCASTNAFMSKQNSSQAIVKKVGVVPYNNGKNRLQFTSDRDAWLANGEKLWHTEDGGKNWLQVEVPDSDSSSDIASFGFSSLSSGWVYKHGKLYKTSNAGKTWIQLPSLPIEYPKGSFHKIIFSGDAQVAWAVGGIYIPVSREAILKHRFPNNTIANDFGAVLYGAIYSSDDGGESWKPQYLSSQVGRYVDIAFSGTKNAVAFGDAGIMFSEDNGDNWVPVKFEKDCTDRIYREHYEGQPLHALLYSSSLGFLSYSDGRLARSNDGGMTWCDFLHPREVWPDGEMNAYFEKIHFSTPIEGWAKKANGTLYRTNDGGKSMMVPKI